MTRVWSVIVAVAVLVAAVGGALALRNDDGDESTPSAAARTSPPTTIQTYEGTDDPFEPTEVTCGRYTVHTSGTWNEKGRLAAVGPKEAVAYEMESDDNGAMTARVCGDLLDRGSTALYFEYYAGGAHCCWTGYVVDLDTGELVFSEDLVNFSMDHAEQLDDGAVELVGWLDTYSYEFGAFAFSPALPAIWGFDGKAYRDVTLRYPDKLRDAQATAKRELEGALATPETSNSGSPGDTTAGSHALLVLALGMALDDDTATTRYLAATLPAATFSWLEQQRTGVAAGVARYAR